MTDIFKTQVNPEGVYHFCTEDIHIVISGFERKLNIQKLEKKAWEIQVIKETCYYAKKFFEKNNQLCNTPALENQALDLYAKYENYGCFISSNQLDNHLFNEFELYLENKCKDCKSSLIKYSNPIQTWPPDVYHYCYKNTHITVKGFDNILERADNKQSNKKAWSDYNRDDSCEVIKNYLNEISAGYCDILEPTYNPIRSYGSCFVAMSVNSSRLEETKKLKENIFDKCKNCNIGMYYEPYEFNNSMKKNNKNYFIPMLLILLIYYLSL